jgi:hypothetical protein
MPPGLSSSKGSCVTRARQEINRFNRHGVPTQPHGYLHQGPLAHSVKRPVINSFDRNAVEILHRQNQSRREIAIQGSRNLATTCNTSGKPLDGPDCGPAPRQH